MKLLHSEVFRRLKQDILPLEGFKTLPTDSNLNIGLRVIERAFPNAVFPVGCLHEFVCSSQNIASATIGFAAALSGKLINKAGIGVWISASRDVFPAALKHFGIEPHQIIFIDLDREKDVLYATEEALKCSKFTTVISEVKDIDFKTSRRFQLATEQSRVTGFIIRKPIKSPHPIACVSRWQVTAVPSALHDNMPGVGFPRWQLELLKVRNGSPGKWTIEWSPQGFKEVKENTAISLEVLRKVV